MITDVCYCPETQKFVVGLCTIGCEEWAGRTVRVFDDKMNRLSEFASPVSNTNARMTADSAYIYFNDRGITPNITAYRWDGTRAGTFTLANSAEAMGVDSTKDMNTQGILSLNGSFYFAAITWAGSPRSTIMRVARTDFSFPKTPTATERDSSFVNIWEGDILDACSDGHYVYVSAASGTGVRVYKVDGETMSIEAKSGEILSTGPGAMMYLKDGELCLVSGGRTYAVSLKDFQNGCTLGEKTSGTLSDSLLSEASDVTYNDDTGMFAVLSNAKSQVLLVEGDGTTVAKTVELKDQIQRIRGRLSYLGNEGEVVLSSITCDEKYVYVTASCKGQKVLPLMLMDYDGEVRSVTQYVSGITLPAANGNYDVRGTFLYRGRLMVIARSLANGGGFVWEVQP